MKVSGPTAKRNPSPGISWTVGWSWAGSVVAGSARVPFSRWMGYRLSGGRERVWRQVMPAVSTTAQVRASPWLVVRKRVCPSAERVRSSTLPPWGSRG